MNPEDAQRDRKALEIFGRAVELASAEARAGYLQGACGDDATLKVRVEALLANHVEDNFLQQPAAGLGPGATAVIPITEKPGDRIGRYKLLQQIGEGGCGVVYMAEQEEPVRRRVALKVIKLGMDTKSVIARFEAERQALAMMDHPNIAKVLDAGATDTGRPYFVMELVKGIKITEYCDRNNLPTRQRLDLFIQVCHAIQHAHQKGIIHRDIKPSNILVTLHDGVPVPKVIDFGIAKATEQRLTDKTVFTAFEQFIGTPAYTSPEQAEMSGLDIDTRSDIYALGVLLYELLTGTTPFDPKELMAAGLDEMRRTIREKEPARPSTRLSTMLAGELTATAQHRQAEPPRLIHLVRGDLDWIVMKCLEKDRTRRYETANGLAADLKRHLNNEPVVARPPSAAYRFQKAWRRNKLAFAAGTAVVCALVSGMAVSTWMFTRERQAHSLAVVAQAKTKTALAEEARQRQQVQREQGITRQNLYAADMNVVQQALDDGNYGRARSLLEAHRPRRAEDDLRGFEWRYFWKRCQGDQLHTFAGHSNVVTCVAFSRDGKILASGSWDHTVRLWNPTSKQTIETLYAHDNHVVSLCFSPDGRVLATGGEDGLLKMWDVKSRKIISTVEAKSPRLAFSPAGTLLAIGSSGDIYGLSGGQVRLWDYIATKEVLTLPESGGRAAFSPTENIVATANWNGAIKLWNIVTGRNFRTLTDAGRIISLDFSPDGRRLATSNWEGEVKLWEAATGQPLSAIKGHAARVWSVAFSPDGNLLATGSSDQTIHLSTVASRPEQVPPTKILRGHSSEVWSVAFSPNGNLLASGGKDATVMLWSTESNVESQTLTNISIGYYSPRPVFSPDASKLTTIAGGNRVTVWEVARKRLTGTFKCESPILDFSQDGKMLLASAGGLLPSPDTPTRLSTLQFWDVENQSSRRTISLFPQDEGVTATKLSPDGRILVTGNNDGNVKLWDAENGRALGMLRGHAGQIVRTVFSPNSQILGTTSRDKTAKLWNVATQKEVETFVGHKDGVFSLSFSPDGQTLATGSIDNTIKIWDLASRKQLAVLAGHKEGVFWVEFSRDGKTLASASADGSVKLWNLATHREVANLKHNREVPFVAFSPDGQTLISGSLDGLLHFWFAPTLAEIDGNLQ